SLSILNLREESGEEWRHTSAGHHNNYCYACSLAPCILNNNHWRKKQGGWGAVAPRPLPPILSAKWAR
ncbi:MAG: hypothetical protein MJE68_17550, partial [Proteobacteria bacterium]|nr:hypothetical protein [Pseudomonadota bacterium]